MGSALQWSRAGSRPQLSWANYETKCHFREKPCETIEADVENRYAVCGVQKVRREKG
jgi:hypothetical protein